MMDVFAFRDELVTAYERFTRSLVRIQAPDIKAHVNQEYAVGRFWPATLVQLNLAFVPGGDIGQFVREGLLNPECERIFRFGKTLDDASGTPLFGVGGHDRPAEPDRDLVQLAQLVRDGLVPIDRDPRIKGNTLRHPSSDP
jgi:hypothetical protein